MISVYFDPDGRICASALGHNHSDHLRCSARYIKFPSQIVFLFLHLTCAWEFPHFLGKLDDYPFAHKWFAGVYFVNLDFELQQIAYYP